MSFTVNFPRYPHDIPVFTPEAYGAAGNGAANDTAAFIALALAVNAAGGGLIDLTPDATYIVGSQVFVPQGTANSNSYAYLPPNWTAYGAFPQEACVMDFQSCARPVIIRGNGARLKTASGVRYGSFNYDGTAKATSNGYTGDGGAMPFKAVIAARDCAGITISDLELDGNIQALNIGGPWGDTGIQLGHTGIYLKNVPALLSNVKAHHFGLDGISVNGRATLESDGIEQGRMVTCRFDYNARNGLSFVGGRGWEFVQTTFNFNGGNFTGAPIHSNPASGIDFEAEGGKINRDVSFKNCDMIGNFANAIVADQAPLTNRVRFDSCRFVATRANSYATWFNRPGPYFDNCIIAGTNVNTYGGAPGTSAANPFEAFRARRTIFTNSNEHSPTGTVATINNLLFESVGGAMFLDECVIDNNIAGGGQSVNYASAHMRNCTVRSRSGDLYFYGDFSGPLTLFQEFGTGRIATTPGGGNDVLGIGRDDAGRAFDSWTLINASFATYNGKPTVDQRGNAFMSGSLFQYFGTMAAGEEMLCSVPVTGAVAGDYPEASFRAATGNAIRIAAAYVSAPDTVTVVVKNPSASSIVYNNGLFIDVRVSKK